MVSLELLIRILPHSMSMDHYQFLPKTGYFSPKTAKKSQFWPNLGHFWLIFGILSFRICSAKLTVLPALIT